VEKSARVERPQAAEPSDLETDVVAALVVVAALDESDVDEEESEEELPDSEDAAVPEMSAPWGELLRGPPWPLRRSLRESLR
jgi:hypothetical protein